ncbi:MAG: hypothetical protein Q8K26_04410 [Candidatus Gracilibacteria bacterium]|nr:hypothetical protein [Candidatus Gracilibacteria bacterium]
MSEKITEQPQTEEYQENYLREKLKKKGVFEKYPNLKCQYLGNNYFAIDLENDGNIEGFFDYMAHPYIRVDETRKDMIRKKRYDTVLKLAGYEEKQENGIYNLYKNGTKIDQMTRAYFDAWNDILFFEVYIHINTINKKDYEASLYDNAGLKSMGNEEVKCLRFKHIKELYKRIEFSDYSFELYLRRIKPEIVLSWITEPRFDRLGDPVTQAELDEYLKQGYISKELHEMCTQALRDKLRLQSEKQSKRDQEQTHTQVSYSALKGEDNMKA